MASGAPYLLMLPAFFVFLAELSADPLFSAFRVEQTLVSCVETARGFSLVPTVACFWLVCCVPPPGCCWFDVFKSFVLSPLFPSVVLLFEWETDSRLCFLGWRLGSLWSGLVLFFQLLFFLGLIAVADLT